MASSASPASGLNPELTGEFSQLPVSVTTARWGLAPGLKKEVGWAASLYLEPRLSLLRRPRS